MSVSRQIVKRTMATVVPRYRFLLNGPTRANLATENSITEIALTFDDGPHPTWTPAVLNALSNAGWKGTFFVIGERVERYPELVRRIIDEGHTLGNHTYTHSSPEATSAKAFLDEVKQTERTIHRLTGISTSLVRPPLGNLSWPKFRGLWKSQQSIVLWNVDPKDFAMQTAMEAAAWAEAYRPRTGDVVLLHDRLPHAAQIVRELSERWGETIRSVSVSEWTNATVGSHHPPARRDSGKPSRQTVAGVPQ